MKKLWLFWVIALLLFATPQAQAQSITYDPATHCTGWHNPTNFTSTGGQANTQWSGLTGTKPMQASNCVSGINWSGTTISAANLASSSSSYYCTYPSTNSVDINGQEDMNRRFVIKGNGTAPSTSNHLTYLPANYSNGTQYTMVPGFTSSIRLGNYCGNAEVEALRYTFDVKPGNALMTLWYAMEVQNGQHNSAENPELIIYVEVLDQNNQWMRVGGDTLCMYQATPTTSSSNLSGPYGYGFYVANTGTQSGAHYGSIIYRPWERLSFPLWNYLYRTARITIVAGDCANTAHYGQVYIAGDCSPFGIVASSCYEGGGDTVAVVEAPELPYTYTWYRNITSHTLSEEEWHDDANLQLIPGATSAVYHVRESDFAIVDTTTGNTAVLPQTTIVCKIHTGNPGDSSTMVNTITMATNVSNLKPIVDMAVEESTCNGIVSVSNRSHLRPTVGDPGTIDTASIYWAFYDSPHPSPADTPLSEQYGNSATMQYTSEGQHSVLMRVSNTLGSETCTQERLFPITSMMINPVQLDITAGYGGIGDTIHLTDNTLSHTGDDFCSYRRWVMHYAAGRTDTIYAQGTDVESRSLHIASDTLENTIELWTSAFSLDDTSSLCVSYRTVEVSTRCQDYTTTLTDEADGLYLLWNNIAITRSGDYTIVVHSEAGCDSVAHLNLTIHDTAMSHIDEPALLTIRAYPNPTSGMVQVTCDSPIRSLRLIDMQGVTRLTSREEEINLRDLPAGPYLLRIETADGVALLKIIKQ